MERVGNCSTPPHLPPLLLLLLPLAKCRGPARTRVANACLLVHGVLLEFRRWAKSSGVLHAAVDCLKQMLRLANTGALLKLMLSDAWPYST